LLIPLSEFRNDEQKWLASPPERVPESKKPAYRVVGVHPEPFSATDSRLIQKKYTQMLKIAAGQFLPSV
jgi:hypothetical protein